MLKKIKLNDENKDKNEFIASIDISNRLIDELSEISLQIEIYWEELPIITRKLKNIATHQ